MPGRFAVGHDQLPIGGEVLASSARTADATSDACGNLGARGCHVIINVTADPASGGITPHIQGQDPVSLVWYDLLVGAAIDAVGTTVLKVYPGITAAANAAASDCLPQVWRVFVDHTAAGSLTYSVGAVLLP